MVENTVQLKMRNQGASVRLDLCSDTPCVVNPALLQCLNNTISDFAKAQVNGVMGFAKTNKQGRACEEQQGSEGKLKNA